MSEIRIIPESIQLLKMSDAEYFSPKYAHYLSNSKIGLLNPEEGGSLEKFTGGFTSKYNDSFALGDAVHGKVLIPDEYIISDIRCPNGKLGVFAENVMLLRRDGFTIYDALIKASEDADYYSGSLPKLIVTARNLKHYKPKFKSSKRMSDAIRNSLDFYFKRNKVEDRTDEVEVLYLSNKIGGIFESCMEGIRKSKFDQLLKPEGLFSAPDSYNEYAILCDVEVIEDDGLITIVPLKGKIDNFTVDHEEKVITLNDLKTTGKPVNFFMGGNVRNDGVTEWYDGSFQRFRYYRQFALYFWMLVAALKEVKGLEGYSTKANILVVETIPNFDNRVYKVNNSHIQAGLSEFKQLLMGYVKWKNS